MSTVMRLVLILALLAPALRLRSQQAIAPVDFRSQVQPVFDKNCKGCHQGASAAGDLRLDSSAGLLKGGKSGQAIVPGKSENSLIVKRITEKTDARMPLKGEPLANADIRLISAWIDQGASVDLASSSDFFATKVQPIFSRSCYSCHSGAQPKGQFNLSVKAQALKGGVLGKDILPGNSAESRLIHRVLGSGSERKMPLTGQPLTTDEIANLRRWIDEGAVWPDGAAQPVASAPKHWAYVKPVRPQLPPVKDAAWVRNPIDNFVLARLEKEGLKPSPEATKETLIRRLSLDLIGLPPTPAEVDAFVADTRADAYERLVDRLLASPRYGERWATPWLDLARFGDSEGWTNDRQREAWPYRDWVIRAFNNNIPFDQFTIEQLAGDLLPNATIDQKIATGFVRSSMLQSEGGTDPAENNWTMQLDRASTVGTTWLGSSVACAQCHDHKYDPFTQKQFYQLVAFFNNSAFVDPSDPGVKKVPDARLLSFAEPTLSLPSPEQSKKRDEINAELAGYLTQLNDSSPEFYQRQRAWEERMRTAGNDWKSLRPTRLTSSGGATLSVRDDNAILASGKNPESDTYVLESAVPVSKITGIRIEAIPDKSLPGGGPGRDYYGNFMVHDIKIEVGAKGHPFTKVAVAQTVSDVPPPQLINTAGKKKQLWIVDATRQFTGDDAGKVKKYAEKLLNNELNAIGAEGRIPVQLLLVPERPLNTGINNDVLRVTIEQSAEVGGVNIGHFRVSVTDTSDPKAIVEIPAALRRALNSPPEIRTPEQERQMTAHYRTVASELAPVRQKIAELRERIAVLHIPQALILAENPKVLHPSTYIRERGAFVAKGDLVEADVPSFLGSMPTDAPPNRLGLAKWLVSRDNPLTARVTVNHFWETIFGRGIVETSDDFGTQGTPPSHPELLDWLATEFMDRGWDMKGIQRLIVTSSTYRQSSVVTPELKERDPDNALLARGPRFRVEAEMIRDITLSASGLLSAKMFGPPVMPYQPPGLWGWFPGRQLGRDEWIVSPGEDKYRRGLYTFIRRTVRYPSLVVFDAPSREVCTARRVRSDNPLQALTALNDPAFFESAQAMAKRLVNEGGADISSRAAYGFELALSRKPTERELSTVLSEFEKDRQYFERHQKEAEAVSGKPDAQLAAWTMFSNAILNLDEAITKE